MQRVTSDTARWPRRLIVATAVSLGVHGLVLLAPVRPPSLPQIELQVQHAVELGLERAVEVTPTAPPPASEPALPAEASPRPAPSSPPTASEPPAPRATEPPAEPPPLPELPTPDLRLTPPSVLLVPDDAAAADAVASAEDAADEGAADAAVLASTDAAPVDVEDREAPAVALADAPVNEAPTAPPSIASAAGELAAAIPQGSVVTLVLKMDRVRANPNGVRVSELLEAIRDWRAVLDGTEIDPVRDLDTILLASANPFGTAQSPPDILAVVRSRAPRGFLRASVEQMAGARPPSGLPAVPSVDGGSAREGQLREHFARPDAGALPPPTRRIWRRQGGVEVTTIDRYLGPHEVVLLGDDLAAIAPRARVPQLLAVLGPRGAQALARGGDPRLLLLLHAEGLRNLLALPGRATLIPRRAEVALRETRAGDAPDGGVTLSALLPYEDDAQAARAAPLLAAFARDLQDTVDTFANTLQGRVAAASGAVHFDRLRGALQALRVEADGAGVRVTATWTSDEVAELLNVQRLAQIFQ